MEEGLVQQQRLLFGYFNEINIIAQLSSKLFEQQLPDGLTTSQFAVLNWFLRVDDVSSPGRLARAFQVTGGAMTNTLKKLEAKGFVLIEPDETSGRQKKVSLTQAGRSAREASLAAVAPLLDEFAEALDPEKTVAQVSDLSAVRQYLDEFRFRGDTT